MNPQTSRPESGPTEPPDRALRDPGYRAAPTGMQDGRGARRMRQEDRHTIRDRDGGSDSAIEPGMPIGAICTQPAAPAGLMYDEVRAMHLRRAGEPRRAKVGNRSDQAIPTAQQVRRWLGGVRAERSRVFSAALIAGHPSQLLPSQTLTRWIRALTSLKKRWKSHSPFSEEARWGTPICPGSVRS